MFEVTYVIDGFRNTYEAEEYYNDENEMEIILKNNQKILINKRETTIISIIKVGEIMEYLNECKLPNEVKNFWLSICNELEEKIYCEAKGYIIGEEVEIKIKLKKINYNCGMNFRLNDMKKEFIIDSIINCLRYDLYTIIFKER